MKRLPILLLCLTLAFTWMLTGCSSDDEGTYPSIITEFANMKTNESGVMKSFTTDDNHTYQITNLLEGYLHNTLYRVVCGFVPEGNKARVYQLYGAYLLRDSLKQAQRDPTGVVSAWRRGRFINLHLSPLTQGGTQYWGFITDSIHPQHTFLSLHHRQGEDPLSYTKTVYASIPLDSIATYNATDTVTLVIQTFQGAKRFDFTP
ncbi:MAG: hypothetical protein J5661_05410 [Bacteroidaceae bacterium]|nr:hypothetical protein [Bacteroidaceae bacterium]